MRVCEGGYRVAERNAVADVPRGESSGIGVASCKKIMESHGGSFEIETHGEQCVCVLFIPSAPAIAPAEGLAEESPSTPSIRSAEEPPSVESDGTAE